MSSIVILGLKKSKTGSHSESLAFMSEGISLVQLSIFEALIYRFISYSLFPVNSLSIMKSMGHPSSHQEGNHRPAMQTTI